MQGAADKTCKYLFQQDKSSQTSKSILQELAPKRMTTGRTAFTISIDWRPEVTLLKLKMHNYGRVSNMNDGSFRLSDKNSLTKPTGIVKNKPSGPGLRPSYLQPPESFAETRNWRTTGNCNYRVSWNVGGNGIELRRKDRTKTLVYKLSLRDPKDQITKITIGKNIQVVYTRPGGPGVPDKELMDTIDIKTNPNTKAENPGVIEREKLLTPEAEGVQKPEKQPTEPPKELSKIEKIAGMLPGIRFSEALETLSLEEKQEVELSLAAQPDSDDKGLKLTMVRISIRDHGAKKKLRAIAEEKYCRKEISLREIMKLEGKAFDDAINELEYWDLQHLKALVCSELTGTAQNEKLNAIRIAEEFAFFVEMMRLNDPRKGRQKDEDSGGHGHVEDIAL